MGRKYVVGILLALVALIFIVGAFFIGQNMGQSSVPPCQPCVGANKAITCADGKCSASTSAGVVLNSDGTQYIPCGSDGIYGVKGGSCTSLAGKTFSPFVPPVFNSVPGSLELVPNSGVSASDRIGWSAYVNIPVGGTFALNIGLGPGGVTLTYPGTGSPTYITHLTPASVGGLSLTATYTSLFNPLYLGLSVQPATRYQNVGTNFSSSSPIKLTGGATVETVYWSITGSDKGPIALPTGGETPGYVTSLQPYSIQE